MTTRTDATPPFVVTHARIVGGFLLLLPIPFALLGALSSSLIVPGDAAATANHILASESLFRLGIVRTLLLMLFDACLLVLVFYQLLKPVNKTLAVLMVILNLPGVVITLSNELNNFAILLLLHGADASRAFTPDQMHAAVSLLLQVHDTGGLIAGLFWGLWLVPYAVLVFRSGFLPKFIGVVLIIECFGFLIQSFGGFFVPTLGATLALLPTITSLAELFLPLWLLIRGVNVEQWAKQARASA
ncbi:MAG TPA: DUF4386 domain-containing protein [Ktedonobacterales bacterium]